MMLINKQMNSEITQEAVAKMFDSTEGVVKHLISAFVDRASSELFDQVPETAPIMFECKEKKYKPILHMCLYLTDHCDVSNRPREDEKIILESVKFYKYAIEHVYTAIVKTILVDEVKIKMMNYTLRWDDTNYTFYLEYYPQECRIYEYYKVCLNNVLEKMSARAISIGEGDSNDSKITETLLADISKYGAEVTKYKNIVENSEFKATVSNINGLINGTKIKLVCKYVSKTSLITDMLRPKHINFGGDAFS